MFSQTAEYALRAIVWLADRVEDDPVGARHIAAATLVPTSYLSKVLQELSRAGLVSSRRGVGGGHALARAPDEITILDVVNAVDPVQRIRGCPLGLKSHQNALCGMHARLDDAMRQVEESLRGATVADILATPERPRPMKETLLAVAERDVRSPDG